MKELRVRVWSNETCYKYTDEGVDTQKGCWISPARLKLNDQGIIIDTHNESIVIDQFTGLFDSTNKPIFINDYITWESFIQDGKICYDKYDKYIVIWHNNSICALSEYQIIRPIGNVRHATIVGNVHEG